MEPASEPVTQYRIVGSVARCFISDRRWYVQFDGSWESLCIGPVLFHNEREEPAPFTAGEIVDIIIRKRT